MLEFCPICKQKLHIGMDTKRKEYDQEYKAKFEAGEITIDELLEHVHVYIDRTMLCFNSGNENTMTDESGVEFKMNPPCANFYGKNGGTIEKPFVVVETVVIEDN